jgi:TetR/AcrR family transcriptional repressor of nem operon
MRWAAGIAQNGDLLAEAPQARAYVDRQCGRTAFPPGTLRLTLPAGRFLLGLSGHLARAHVSHYDENMSQRAAQKAESRGAILRTAAALLREHGVAGMSVERAMAGAGLTVGAFYAHFKGKDELLDHAFALALDEIGAIVRSSAGHKRGRTALADVVSTYLSEGHRDQAASGCPMPAVVSSALLVDDRPLRHLVATGLMTLCERIGDLGGADITSERALALAVIMVGGQLVARATRGTPISSRVLIAARDAGHALLRTSK